MSFQGKKQKGKKDRLFLGITFNKKCMLDFLEVEMHQVRCD